MSLEQNKALDYQWYERINAHDLEGALALVSPDFVDHENPTAPGGLEGLRRFFTMQLAAFPDMHANLLSQQQNLKVFLSVGESSNGEQIDQTRKQMAECKPEHEDTPLIPKCPV